MRKQAVAFTCSIALLASGCGGGGSTTSTSTISAARRTALCATVVSARNRYLDAARQMGLGFQNRRLEGRTRAAARAFRRRLEALRDATSAAQRREVDQLVLTLSEQDKMFAAFEVHNLSEAARYGNALNAPLQEALAKLHTVCPGA